MTVQFGVHIGPQNATLAELRQLWTWLDRAGMDWISVWDHLYEAPPAGGTQPHFEAVATLGAIAADTERARLGCLVFCALYRNVGLLAKSAVTIDHLSGGRFELGIGSGWHEEEARAFGLPFPAQRERHEVLDGSVRALRSLFSGQRATMTEPGVSLADASCLRVLRAGSRSGSGAPAAARRSASPGPSPMAGTPPTSEPTRSGS